MSRAREREGRTVGTYVGGGMYRRDREAVIRHSCSDLAYYFTVAGVVKFAVKKKNKIINMKRQNLRTIICLIASVSMYVVSLS